MKNLKSYTSITVFALTLIGFIFFSASCGADPTPETVDTASEINGFATDEIQHTHTVGKDPCPQDFTVSISIRCNKVAPFTQCDADSVVLTNPSPGLSAAFRNGQQSRTLNSSEGLRYIDLKFTCQIAQSFIHEYILVFYQDGIKVGEEKVKVDVTVIQ